MRISGVGLAATISLVMDQIFCFAPSIKPDIEPVVSSTKQTSMRGLAGLAAASLLLDFDALTAWLARAIRPQDKRVLAIVFISVSRRCFPAIIRSHQRWTESAAKCSPRSPCLILLRTAQKALRNARQEPQNLERPIWQRCGMLLHD